MTDKDIAIIIPAYNEEQTLPDTLRGFHKIAPNARLVVVNNASTDRTDAVARETLDQLGARGQVLLETRKGKGNAVRSAFHHVSADVYVMVDADTTYPADQLPELVAKLEDGADMVVGDRLTDGHYFRENKRVLGSIGNVLVKSLINWLFDAKIADVFSGYRVFSRRFVKNYPVMYAGFEIETEMTVHALDKRFKIIELPVRYRDRPSGSASKLHPLRDGYRVLKTLMWIFKNYRPLPFFGSLAAVIAGGSALAGTPVILEFLQTGQILRLPLAVLASGLGVLSLILLSCGLILDTVASNHRFDFEHRLLQEDLSELSKVAHELKAVRRAEATVKRDQLA